MVWTDERGMWNLLQQILQCFLIDLCKLFQIGCAYTFVNFMNCRIDWPQLDNLCPGRRDKASIRCSARSGKLGLNPRYCFNCIDHGIYQRATGCQKWLSTQNPLQLIRSEERSVG